MQQLNTKPEISLLNLLTSSTVINKGQKKPLNLTKLVENFALDVEIDNHGVPGYLHSPPRPAFISKSYYQSIPEYAYNYPPKGPIPVYFECLYCEQVGPESHLTDCKRPFESSLVLTQEGEPVFKKNAGTSYKLVVVKRGQKKTISTDVKNQKFSNNIDLIYENENRGHTTVKIGKNGTINVISAQYNDRTIIDNLIKKINKVQEYTVLSNDMYIVLAQFQLYPKNDIYFVNLKAIDLNLWHTPLFKQKINGQYVFKIGNKMYNVENYRYNPGNITSKSNRSTNPFIQFDIVSGIYKIGILIYRKGAVQMRLSYLNKSENTEPLHVRTLQEVYTFLKQLFTILIINSSETNYPIIVTEAEKEKKGILNTIDGRQPQVCHNRKGYELQPVPYSFYGKCPIQGFYVRPEGKKRPDGKFEPCCYKIKKSGKDSVDYINGLLREGFTVPEPDTLSAIYKPGTKIIESRGFKGLQSFNEKELIDFIEKAGYIGQQSVFSVKKDYTVYQKSVISEFLTNNVSFQHFITYKRAIKPYYCTGIHHDAIRVFLFFNKRGESFFININKDVTNSTIGDIPQLKNTIIDGFLVPYTDFVFYPIDIVYQNGTSLMQQVYSKRFDVLMYILDLLNEVDMDVQIITDFSDNVENIIQGEKILFIESGSLYTPGKINKGVQIWEELGDLFISLNVKHYTDNRWTVSVNGKSISDNLLPQRNSSVEIPVIFINKNDIKDNDIIVFKITLNTDKTINYNKPLQPIEKVTSHINEYPDVVNILESIKNPVKKPS